MKKITLFVIITAIAGSISLMLTSNPLSWYTNSGLRNIFEALNLDLATGNNGSHNRIIINLFAYLLLLTGGLLYCFSKGKEIRLIRFSLAVISLSKILSVLTSTLLLLNYSSFTATALLSFLFYRTIDVAWIYVAVKVLTFLNKTKQLDIRTTNNHDATSNLPVIASSAERIFHLIVDAAMTVFLFSGLFNILIFLPPFTKNLYVISGFIGEYTLVFLILALFRISYYLFFERLFAASPAKFLTETRVVRENNEAITLKISFIRNISRFVPLEPFSFIFSHTGWHDKWSDTTVQKEEKTGVKGCYYFLLIPLITLVYFGGTYGINSYSNYANHRNYKHQFQEQMSDLNQRIKTLNTNDIIELQDIDQEFNLLYFKPEKIEGDRLVCSIVSLNNNYEYHPDRETIEDFYSRHEWPQITLKKQDLKKGIAGEFDSYRSFNSLVGKFEEGEGFKAENITGRYAIKSIEPYFQPNLQVKESKLNNAKEVYLGLVSKGWKGEITSIKNIDKDIKWNEHYPLRLERKYQTALLGTSKDYIDQFTIEVTVKDSLGRSQVYKIENTNDAFPKCTKIK